MKRKRLETGETCKEEDRLETMPVLNRDFLDGNDGDNDIGGSD